MTHRIALLRAINLGRTNRMPMADLRDLAASLGFGDAATHLQSGNLLYTSTGAAADDRSMLSRAIHERFGFGADVVVLDAETLARVVDTHPFADGDPKSVHAGFASGPLPESLEADLQAIARDWERFQVAGDVLFADYGGRLHDSRAANALARLVRPEFITLRNLATLRALVARSS